MNKFNTVSRFVIQLIVCIGLSTSTAFAANDHHGHGHDDHETEIVEKKGPHGGALLEGNNLAIEIIIMEQALSTEMRVYGYQDNKAINLSSSDISVELHRLGGEQTTIQLNTENDYLVSQQTLNAPHSFEIHIEADYQGQHTHWMAEHYEGRTELTDRQLALAEIETAIVGPERLVFHDTLFGVIEADQDRVFHVTAPYIGRVEKVHVRLGDEVEKGQKLLTLSNTQTLQRYTIKSVATGVITNRMINAGERAGEHALLEITDLSQVWVDMSAFPESIEKISIGQKVIIYDLHQHERIESTVSYIAPIMTGGHIARARAVIDNADGHWRPGMHIKADIETSKKHALAVKIEGLQTLQGDNVVFAKYGNTFEVRPLELGLQNGEFAEVLSGLKAGTEYVTNNSFLLKADLLKAGASHDH